MEYEIKKGHGASLEGDGLKSMLEEAFGKVKEEGGMLVSSYGALSRIEVKLKDKNTLVVNTTSDRSASTDAASDTIKKYNIFLEKATGFDSKQRRTRLQKKAKEGKL